MKYIHQVWIQGLEHFKENQPKMYEYSLKWSELFPSSIYKMWSEQEIIPLIQQFSPVLLQKYLFSPHYANKSDIARYVILYMYGGLYVDTDYEPFKRFDYLFDESVSLAVVKTSFTPGKQSLSKLYYNNAWIYAKPKFFIFHDILEYISSQDVKNYKSSFDYTMLVTGPQSWTNVIERCNLKLHPEIRIFPHTFIELVDFSNGALRFSSMDELLDLFPWAIGVHRCSASWIPAKLNTLRDCLENIYMHITNWSDHLIILLTCLICLLLIIKKK